MAYRQESHVVSATYLSCD